MTREILERLEAYVVMPVAPAQPHASNHTYNVTTGSSNQVQFGQHVTGSQSMVTTQQVFEGLAQQIQKSNAITPEQKKNALAKLKDFTSLPGVSELIKLGAIEAFNAVKHLLVG
jgi:hypothetical protein